MCVLTKLNFKQIEQNFHSVPWVMPQGWDLGVLGVKFLAKGFVMAPHWLHILAFNFICKVCFLINNLPCNLLMTCMIFTRLM